MTYKIGRPKRKMKQVVKWLEECIFQQNCEGCPYGEYNYMCMDQLRTEALWYLRQTIEKSEMKVKK